MDLSDRNAALLEGVDPNKETGLEIGPLDMPVVSRKPGRPIYYPDYADRGKHGRVVATSEALLRRQQVLR